MEGLQIDMASHEGEQVGRWEGLVLGPWREWDVLRIYR